MWAIFDSAKKLSNVTHFSKCDPFLIVWPTSPNRANCSKWPILRMWPIFHSVPHLFKCVPFFAAWPIFLRVTHFSQCDPLLQRPCFHSVTYFIQSDQFLTVWPVFPHMTFRKMGHSVRNSSQCEKMRLSVKHWATVGIMGHRVVNHWNPFSTLWPIFYSVTHFSKRDPFYTVCNIFYTVTHF